MLIAIFLLALILRFFNLSSNPPALTWDEASWGYNAYILGQTGRDEFGQFPVTFLESFGDFKPPVYAYLSIFSVWLFGLNEFSARFASALLGSSTILISYFLVLEIFFNSKNKKVYGLIASFLLAISPWHILLSRAAFEANVATFFIILGVFLFLYSTRERYQVKFLFLSLLSFLLAMNTFNTSRVFLPLFVLFLFAFKKRVIFERWKTTLIGIFPVLLLSVPLMLFMATPQAQLRFQEVNIFSDLEVIKRTNQQIQNDNNEFYSRVIHNRRLAYAAEYLKHYLDNLNPNFLFINGDGNPKFSIRDVGQMYLWELPFIVIGSVLLFRKKEGNWIIIPVWIALGIVPAATARETPHALRIETILPIPQILVSLGLFYSFEYMSKMRHRILKINLKALIFSLSILLFIFSFLYFLHNYFNHYPITYASEWQYGYKDAVKFAESKKDDYKNIYFTKDLGRPYIYVLFFGNYSPNTLLSKSNITREALGFVHVNSLGKYKFSDTLPKPEKGSLYINTPGKVPSGVNVLKTFYLPNGEIVLVAYET